MKRSIRMFLMIITTLALMASLASADPKPPGGGDSGESISAPDL